MPHTKPKKKILIFFSKLGGHSSRLSRVFLETFKKGCCATSGEHSAHHLDQTFQKRKNIHKQRVVFWIMDPFIQRHGNKEIPNLSKICNRVDFCRSNACAYTRLYTVYL